MGKIAQSKKPYERLILETLKKNQRPMNYREITKAVLKHRTARGKTPKNTVYSVLIRRPDLFERTEKGMFRLRKKG